MNIRNNIGLPLAMIAMALSHAQVRADIVLFNSTSPDANELTRDDWLAALAITDPIHRVDFESGFSDGQAVSGVNGLFPAGLVIVDTSGDDAAVIRSGDRVFGGSNPVGTYSLGHNERPFLKLDFSASPIDYVAFQDIDQAGTAGLVTFVGGATAKFSIETTDASGDTAEFVGLLRNDMPPITSVELDASGDTQWAIDNLEYGVLSNAPAINATPASGLVTTETGGTDAFSVSLATEPSADVTLNLSSSDATEGTVDFSQLTFTPEDWNVGQTVTVTGQDDTDQDSDFAYTIAIQVSSSTDTDYSSLGPVSVGVTNLDDDTAPPDILVSNASGETSENGDTATITVRVLGQPSANISIAVSSSDPGEGLVEPTSLQFTPANANQLQAVTISGQDDVEYDGDQRYTVLTGRLESADPNYNGRKPADVTVVNIDNEAGAIFNGGFESF